MLSVRDKSLTGIRLPRTCIFKAILQTLSAILAAILFCATPHPAFAQSNDAEVHVVSRVAIPSASTPPAVRANVDMVLVNVTVLDRSGRSVAGLESGNFTLLDEKQQQKIRYLSNADEPISLVVVLDASASMAARIDDERKAVAELIATSNPADDLALIAVSDRPQLVLRFEDSIDNVPAAVSGIQPSGETALWDAMYLGLKELKNSRYPRKAMILISDGGDNHSRYSESELRSLLKEADVGVYAIGLFNRYASRREEKVGPLQLDEVTLLTGGRVFAVQSPAELSRAITDVSRELRNQYVLGYYPTNRSRNGNWRKLKVQIAGPASREKLRLYSKKGYYAPAD